MRCVGDRVVGLRPGARGAGRVGAVLGRLCVWGFAPGRETRGVWTGGAKTGERHAVALGYVPRIFFTSAWKR